MLVRKKGEPAALYVDNTVLSSQSMCDTKTYIRHALHYDSKEEAGALKAGIAIHNVLERWFKGEHIDDALGALDDYLPWADAAHEKGLLHPRFAGPNVYAVCHAYMQSRDINRFPWITDPKKVEIAVVAQLTKDNICVCGHGRKKHSLGKDCSACACPEFTIVNFTGKLDLIGTLHETGHLIPIDHKSTGQINANFVRKYALDSQMSGYIWLAEQHVHLPIRQAFVNAIQLNDLPKSDRKCTTHSVPYAECSEQHLVTQIIGPIIRTEEQLIEWRRAALSLSKEVRDLIYEAEADWMPTEIRQQGTFNGSCGFCSLGEYCRSNRPPARKALVPYKWNPGGVVVED